VAFPLTGPVAAVAALDEDPDEFRIVDGWFVALLIDVVELRVDVHDLRHDVRPLRWGDMAVHIERQVSEGAQAGRIEVPSAEVTDELLLPCAHRGVSCPDCLQRLSGVVVETGTSDGPQQGRRHTVHG
jgi:hypothetical protein